MIPVLTAGNQVRQRGFSTIETIDTGVVEANHFDERSHYVLRSRGNGSVGTTATE